jgi:excisionase family DNA binding protein
MILPGGANVSETFLTPEQAAKMLNLSAYTVRAYARQGVIPAHKIGRTWRFSKSDLEEWVLTDGQARSSRPEGVLVVRDCSSEAEYLPSPEPVGTRDVADKRSQAMKTLREMRSQAQKGNVTSIVRESRKQLVDRGHIESDEQ